MLAADGGGDPDAGHARRARQGFDGGDTTRRRRHGDRLRPRLDREQVRREALDQHRAVAAEIARGDDGAQVGTIVAGKHPRQRRSHHQALGRDQRRFGPAVASGRIGGDRHHAVRRERIRQHRLHVRDAVGIGVDRAEPEGERPQIAAHGGLSAGRRRGRWDRPADLAATRVVQHAPRHGRHRAAEEVLTGVGRIQGRSLDVVDGRHVGDGVATEREYALVDRPHGHTRRRGPAGGVADADAHAGLGAGRLVALGDFERDGQRRCAPIDRQVHGLRHGCGPARIRGAAGAAGRRSTAHQGDRGREAGGRRGAYGQVHGRLAVAQADHLRVQDGPALERHECGRLTPRRRDAQPSRRVRRVALAVERQRQRRHTGRRRHRRREREPGQHRHHHLSRTARRDADCLPRPGVGHDDADGRSARRRLDDRGRALGTGDADVDGDTGNQRALRRARDDADGGLGRHTGRVFGDPEIHVGWDLGSDLAADHLRRRVPHLRRDREGASADQPSGQRDPERMPAFGVERLGVIDEHQRTVARPGALLGVVVERRVPELAIALQGAGQGARGIAGDLPEDRGPGKGDLGQIVRGNGSLDHRPRLGDRGRGGEVDAKLRRAERLDQQLARELRAVLFVAVAPQHEAIAIVGLRRLGDRNRPLRPADGVEDGVVRRDVVPLVLERQRERGARGNRAQPFRAWLLDEGAHVHDLAGPIQPAIREQDAGQLAIAPRPAAGIRNGDERHIGGRSDQHDVRRSAFRARVAKTGAVGRAVPEHAVGLIEDGDVGVRDRRPGVEPAGQDREPPLRAADGQPDVGHLDEGRIGEGHRANGHDRRDARRLAPTRIGGPDQAGAGGGQRGRHVHEDLPHLSVRQARHRRDGPCDARRILPAPPEPGAAAQRRHDLLGCDRRRAAADVHEAARQQRQPRPESRFPHRSALDAERGERRGQADVHDRAPRRRQPHTAVALEAGVDADRVAMPWCHREAERFEPGRPVVAAAAGLGCHRARLRRAGDVGDAQRLAQPVGVDPMRRLERHRGRLAPARTVAFDEGEQRPARLDAALGRLAAQRALGRTDAGDCHHDAPARRRLRRERDVEPVIHVGVARHGEGKRPRRANRGPHLPRPGLVSRKRGGIDARQIRPRARGQFRQGLLGRLERHVNPRCRVVGSHRLIEREADLPQRLHGAHDHDVVRLQPRRRRLEGEADGLGEPSARDGGRARVDTDRDAARVREVAAGGLYHQDVGVGPAEAERHLGLHADVVDPIDDLCGRERHHRFREADLRLRDRRGGRSVRGRRAHPQRVGGWLRPGRNRQPCAHQSDQQAGQPSPACVSHG